MGLTERFWNWLTTSTAGTPKKGNPDLYPLDVAKLTKELRLIEEAKRLGEAGLPAPEAKTLSGPEAARGNGGACRPNRSPNVLACHQ